MKNAKTKTRAKRLRTIRDLVFDDKNANRGTDRGRQLVGHSLERYGAGRSVLADKHGKLIAGNKTVEKALALNKKILVVPTKGDELVVVQRTDLDMDQDHAARELAIADNRAGELGLEWDPEMLQLLQDQGANLEGMFSDAELEAILTPIDANGGPEENIEFDRAAEFQKKWKVKPGDLWTIGPHRLLCGDCRDAGQVRKAIGKAKINVAITSPPYAEQRAYDAASGFAPVPPKKYVEWFKPVSENVATHLASDGSWFVNIKPAGHELDTDLYVFDLVITHARDWGWHFATEFCWERVGVPKHVALRFKNQFEPVYQFTRGRWKIRAEHVRHASDAMVIPFGKGAGNTGWDRWQGTGRPFINKNQIRRSRNSKRGDSMSKLQGLRSLEPGAFIAQGWAYPGNRLPTFVASHDLTGHSAAFPVGLPAFFIKAFSDPGDLVYEPFAGSGSTLVAAQQNERRAFGIEISPKYCALTLERMTRAFPDLKLKR